MDLNEVYMCTNLKGKSSFFLPFNKGCGVGIHSGKGNPHNENGINVSYMWEDILKKDTVLYLIDKIIFLQKETKKDPDTGKRVTKETADFPPLSSVQCRTQAGGRCRRTSQREKLSH